MPKSKLYVYLECVVWANAKGDFHREDGYAWEHSDGRKIWYLNNKFHREDGPACEYSNGYKAWYLNGNKYTEKDYNDKIKSLR